MKVSERGEILKVRVRQEREIESKLKRRYIEQKKISS